MKYLFIAPVKETSDIIPLPGIPSLIGILENKGINCEYINLNAELLDYLDNKKIADYIEQLNYFYEKKGYLDFPDYFQRLLISKKTACMQIIRWLKNNIKYFEEYKKKSKIKKNMYNFSIFRYYVNLVDYIKSIMISSFFSELFEKELKFSINPEDILFIYNNSFDYLKKFYEEKAIHIINKAPNIIGIQISTSNDLISGLMLAYNIKQINKNIHINIGGSYFKENYRKITNIKDLFYKFFDSISIGESTTTVIELTKYINKEIPAEQVTNLMYVEKDQLKYNENTKIENINRLPFQSFTGYKKEDYFLPEFVLPVRASLSFSCYWGKCIYCTCSREKTPFRIISAKKFVNEIEYLSEKYNTKNFTFWDNAIHPLYLSKVADLLIERKLNIKYTVYARLEKEFNYELLKKIKKSGCIAIHWGLDSTSQRICDEIINKNINIKTAEEILKNSHKAGILNHTFLIFGYPTQTIEEMYGCLDFINRNYKYLDIVYTIKDLNFLDHSILYEKYEYYNGLINRTKEFEKHKTHIINKIKQKMKPIGTDFMITQWQYLYIAKYGKLRFNIIRNLKYYYSYGKNKFLKTLTGYYFRNKLE